MVMQDREDRTPKEVFLDRLKSELKIFESRTGAKVDNIKILRLDYTSIGEIMDKEIESITLEMH